MKANELRLGNYIQWNNNKNQIEKINVINEVCVGLESDIITDTLTPISLFNPIPLTEEWLLKFGFDDKTYKDGYIGIDVNHSNFVLTKPGGEYNFEYYSWQFKCDRWPRFMEFKYVHQLQNFYFALTGKELEI